MYDNINIWYSQFVSGSVRYWDTHFPFFEGAEKAGVFYCIQFCSHLWDIDLYYKRMEKKKQTVKCGEYTGVQNLKKMKKIKKIKKAGLYMYVDGRRRERG